MAKPVPRACAGLGPLAQLGAAFSAQISCRASQAPDCDMNMEVCFLESECNRASFIIIVPVNSKPESEPRRLCLPVCSKFHAMLRIEARGVLHLLSLYRKKLQKGSVLLGSFFCFVFKVSQIQNRDSKLSLDL